MADLEYRMNITVRVFGETGWYLAQLSIFEVLYTHSATISGWDVHGMRVFMGSLFLVDVLYMIFFAENLDHMSSLIRKGDLDLYLVKPIDSQFMVSMRKVATAYTFNLLAILVYLIWAIRHLPVPPSGWALLNFALLAACGVVSLYSLRFLFSIITVLVQDAGNVQFIWHQFYRLGTRPDPIYPFYLRLFVLTIFPVAFFASVPARSLVEGYDWKFTVIAPALAAALLFLSHYLWGKALKSYASASS